jgi:hypothetical protein
MTDEEIRALADDLTDEEVAEFEDLVLRCADLGFAEFFQQAKAHMRTCQLRRTVTA